MRTNIDLIIFFFFFSIRLRRPLLQPDVQIRIMARYRRRMVQTKPPNLHSSHNRRGTDRPRHPVLHRALHLSLMYSPRTKCSRRRRSPEDEIRTGKWRSVLPPSSSSTHYVNQRDADVGRGSAPAGSAKEFRIACVGRTIDGWFRSWCWGWGRVW